jgi:hypothetical protein
MNPEKLLAKAQTWKRKSHRLSLQLRLKSLAEARRFLRENGIALWKGKAELPNLLDAIIGRVANGKERLSGKHAEQCDLWRGQILKDLEFIDCTFFCKMPTAMYQDLWPYVTVFALLNREKAEEGGFVSREAKRIVSFLKKEGPTRTDVLRKALKYDSGSDGRLIQRAKQELQNQLILVCRNEEDGSRKTRAELLDLWENRMPKTLRTRADQITEKDARLKVLSATLNVCVLSNEKHIPRWFAWARGGWQEAMDSLIQKKDFVRVENKKISWIIPRKVLSAT